MDIHAGPPKMPGAFSQRNPLPLGGSLFVELFNSTCVEDTNTLVLCPLHVASACFTIISFGQVGHSDQRWQLVVYSDCVLLLSIPREWDLLGKALLIPLITPGIYSARK